jgi:phospho-N-acetylmuramoyl-pentapeptide-transferase
MMYFVYHWNSISSVPHGRGYFPALNVFQYITFRSIAAAVTSFLLSLMFGNWVIRRLISLKVGQPIRTKEQVRELAQLHGGKAGTPTMGGVLLLGSVVVSTLIWGRLTNRFIWLALFTIVYLGLLGFVDDYVKVTRKKSDGVNARVKLIAQLVLAMVVTAFFLLDPSTEVQARALYVPFYKEPVIYNLGWATFFFFALVVMGASNAVNLTDGLDGLATGCTVTVALAFAVLAYVAGNVKFSSYLQVPFYPFTGELTVVCMALAGAGLGFLWFNCHPARVFMGDTGSLAIGGVLGVVAICCKQELLLLVVGGVFVMEALSVILQVMSFKLTGKRIFAMSPIHHHFELKGWKENTVIVRFWILSIMFAAIGLATLKLR